MGYSEDELLSRPINSFIHPADQNLTENRRHKIHEGEPLLNFENRYTKKSGEVIWFSWTSIPKPDQELVYAIAKDVTHQKVQNQHRNELLSGLTRENGLKQLIFSDNGIGFDSSKNKDKIFGLYQTFHNKYDSKGIGLYLVHSHITDLGGSITVESTVDEGTTFTITFKP